jgi:hypothetical protein
MSSGVARFFNKQDHHQCMKEEINNAEKCTKVLSWFSNKTIKLRHCSQFDADDR